MKTIQKSLSAAASDSVKQGFTITHLT